LYGLPVPMHPTLSAFLLPTKTPCIHGRTISHTGYCVQIANVFITTFHHTTSFQGSRWLMYSLFTREGSVLAISRVGLCGCGWQQPAGKPERTKTLEKLNGK